MNNVTKQFKVATLVNITSQESAIAFPHYMYTSILRAATGKPDLNFTITSKPFPMTVDFAEQEDRVSSVFVVFVLAVSFSMVPAAIIGFIGREKEKNLKH